MKTFIVTVSSPSGRFIDSIWVEPKSANERVARLMSEFRRCALHIWKPESAMPGWYAWATESALDDGAFAPATGASTSHQAPLEANEKGRADSGEVKG